MEKGAFSLPDKDWIKMAWLHIVATSVCVVNGSSKQDSLKRGGEERSGDIGIFCSLCQSAWPCNLASRVVVEVSAACAKSEWLDDVACESIAGGVFLLQLLRQAPVLSSVVVVILCDYE
ncbi:hypothetical protein ACOMHN_055263 [Nucella lapillus]